MTFTSEISISDITSVLSVVLVILGGIVGCYQWRKSVLLKRAGYINDLTEKIRTDNDIKKVIYMLDYGNEWYSFKFHGSGEMERKVDKTLSYFSYICYLKEQKIISNKEFYFFKYEVERILMNKQVQDYFYNLYHFSNKFDTSFTFKYLFDYGKKRKMFDHNFYDKEAYRKDVRYHHNLNF
ncbi:MAG TPA: hypothetical protein DCW90_15565 [Lachnospiraceae bacterium]|nr:hypothetical protein [Lachnospiraceae bacterium]